MISNTLLNKTIKSFNNDIILFVKIIPNSNKNLIVEVFEHTNNYYLKIKIKEVALKEKANNELILFLSAILNIPKSNISINQGKTSSLKSIKIKNIAVDTAKEKILNFITET